jgi:hypothetical protein
MQRKKVLLLAYTGYIIRDLLLGKFSVKLTEDVDLVVAVPDSDDEGLIEWAKNRPIQLITYKTNRALVPSAKEYFSVQHWMYRVKQIERENASLEMVTRLYQPSLGWKGRLLVRFMLFAGRIIKALRLSCLAEKIFLHVIGRESATRQWVEILQKIKPSAVISTMLTLPVGMYSYSVDLPVVLAARKLKIPCGTLVQSWDNLSSKTYVLPDWLDRYWTWSDTMSQDLTRFSPCINKNHENIRVVGSPHFDYHLDDGLVEQRDVYMQKLGLDVKLPYILIGTGLEYLLPAEPLVVVNLAKLLQREIPKLQILLRLHPKDKIERWAEHLESLRSLGVVIQNVSPETPMDAGGFTHPREFFYEQVNTIYHASVVINTASSLTVDAAILERPVISFGYDVVKDDKFPEGRAGFYNRSEHFGSLVETGGVWVVHSQNECVQSIRQYLSTPELHATNRRELAQKVGGPLDGMAGVRLASEVLSIVHDD